MRKILVTGAKGQLGRCLKDAAQDYPQYEFYFTDRNELNIEESVSVKQFFEQHPVDYCINAAAYTQVDKAEEEADAAFATNAEGVKNLAQACAQKSTVLLHVSTDYVFDGTNKRPYLESDPTGAINTYGASKLKGEQYIQEICEAYFILRTSWLYSQYGHNFLNSMLRFAEEERDLSITTEQTGTPTNANDLARALLFIIAANSQHYGVYHFSNEGSGTWYDFAEAIFTYSGHLENVKLAKTDQYRTFAQRPAFSVLSKEKFKKEFDLSLIHWKESLQQLIENHK